VHPRFAGIFFEGAPAGFLRASGLRAGFFLMTFGPLGGDFDFKVFWKPIAFGSLGDFS